MRSLVPSGRYAAMYLRGTSVYGPRYRAVLSFPAGVPDTLYTAVILHSLSLRRERPRRAGRWITVIHPVARLEPVIIFTGITYTHNPTRLLELVRRSGVPDLGTVFVCRYNVFDQTVPPVAWYFCVSVPW